MSEIEAMDKPRVKVKTSWSQPIESRGNRDWGFHTPDVPVDAEPPERNPDASLASTLMGQIYGSFKGGLAPFSFLTAGDTGINSSSFSRPDLIPTLQFTLDCINAIREELLHGPRRTVWNADEQQWQILVPSAMEEAEARRKGELSNE